MSICEACQNIDKAVPVLHSYNVQIHGRATAVVGDVYTSCSHHNPVDDFGAVNKHWAVNRPVNTLFTDRATEIGTIEAALRSSQDCVSGAGASLQSFVVTGMGGVGKSELCLKLAQILRPYYWGIFWVDVSSAAAAQSSAVTIARTLGSAEQTIEGAMTLLSNTTEPFLLILDNADNLKTDYQFYMPISEKGTILMTSRNQECATQYGTLGTLRLQNLYLDDSRLLLLKIFQINENVANSEKEAEEVATLLLGCHTLALIQAGHYMKRFYCSLVDYSQQFRQQRDRMLQFSGTTQQQSRYATVYATFEASARQLQSSTDPSAEDALDLMEFLSHVGSSDCPIDLFEAAWTGAQAVLARVKKVPEHTFELGIDLTMWHLNHALPLLQPQCPTWNNERLMAAIYLLESLSLVQLNVEKGRPSSLRMHPLVHSWARERQDVTRRESQWLMSGSTLALALVDTQSWVVEEWCSFGSFAQFHDRFLAPHLLSWMDQVPKDMTLAQMPAELVQIIVVSMYLLDLADYAEYVYEKSTWLAASSELWTEQQWPRWYEFILLRKEGLRRNGKIDQAVSLIQSVLAMDRFKHGVSELAYLDFRSRLAELLSEQGSCEAATTIIENVAEACDFGGKARYPRLDSVCSIHASIYMRSGQPLRAVKVLQRWQTLSQQPRFFTSEKRVAANEWHLNKLLAQCYYDLDEIESCITCIESTLAGNNIWAQNISTDHRQMFEFKRLLGKAYHRSDRVRQAAEVFETLFKLAISWPSMNNPAEDIATELVEIYTKIGKSEDAARLRRELSTLEDKRDIPGYVVYPHSVYTYPG